MELGIGRYAGSDDVTVASDAGGEAAGARLGVDVGVVGGPAVGRWCS